MSVKRSSHQNQKTIDSFFCTQSSARNIESSPQTLLAVPGLSLILDFVVQEEEETLLSFLEGQEWRMDLARR